MEMDKELQKVIVPYINNRQINHLLRDAETSNKLLDILLASKFLDRPDFYSIDKTNNTCYMFEHFGVDASLEVGGRGSTAIHAEKKADKEILKEQVNDLKKSTINANEITAGKCVARNIKTEYTIINLKNNFKRIFNDHYAKIPDYHKHIEDETQLTNLNFVNVFVIEHTTELGGFYYNEPKRNFIFYHTDFVIDKLKQSPAIDYYIFLDKATKIVCVLSKDEIKNLENSRIDTNKERIGFFNDQFMISSFMFVPNSMLNKNTTI